MVVPAHYIGEILKRQPIPPETLHFFRDRFRERVFELIAMAFVHQETSGETSLAEIARRLGRDADAIRMLLANPGTLTLEDLVDLCLVLFQAELDVELAPLADTAVPGPDVPGAPRAN